VSRHTDFIVNKNEKYADDLQNTEKNGSEK